MNRQQEYWALVEQLGHPPAALTGTARRARTRCRRHRRRTLLGSLAGVCAAFVAAVNTVPAFALACGSVPLLRELTAAVAFSPSLSAAVEHDYVQYIGQSRSWEGVTVTLESLITDRQQMVIFYRVDGVDGAWEMDCELRLADGRALEGYAVTSSDGQEGLNQLTIHFMDLEENPEDLILDLKLTGDHTYSFQIHPDPEKTAPTTVVPVEEWVELEGQRLLVDRLELTPTRTVLYLEEDPKNTAWLRDLTFHITTLDGTVYRQVDGNASAVGESDSPGVYTYYFESLYFAGDLAALGIDGAVWLDKGEPTVTVDLTGGTWEGDLPPGVTGLTAERSGADVTVTATSEVSRLPFRQEYVAPGGEHHPIQRLSFQLPGDTGAGRYTFTLKDCPWDEVAMPLAYTRISQFAQPMAVDLAK